MRGWLIAKLALVVVAAALVGVTDGSAAPKVVTVMLTATGPSPSTVRISPYEEVLFVNSDSVAHTVVVRQNKHARWTCPLDSAGVPGGSDQCTYRAEFVSTHAYTVDGQFAGTIFVVGFPRSVTLTARTHAIALGRQLTLHGQLTFESYPDDPVCHWTFSLAIFRRHNLSQHYTHIANFPVSPTMKNMPATNNRCTYAWQRSVRPGVETTYVARVRDVARIWKVATSRPFTVLIRP